MIMILAAVAGLLMASVNACAHLQTSYVIKADGDVRVVVGVPKEWGKHEVKVVTTMHWTSVPNTESIEMLFEGTEGLTSTYNHLVSITSRLQKDLPLSFESDHDNLEKCPNCKITDSEKSFGKELTLELSRSKNAKFYLPRPIAYDDGYHGGSLFEELVMTYTLQGENPEKGCPTEWSERPYCLQSGYTTRFGGKSAWKPDTDRSDKCHEDVSNPDRSSFDSSLKHSS